MLYKPKPFMEIIMSNKTITHEIKLEKSVKIIIGIFAIGVFLNVFAPLLETKSAIARIQGNASNDPLYISCIDGCARSNKLKY